MQNEKYSSLIEQLKAPEEGYEKAPGEYDCQKLTRELIDMNLRRDEFGEYNMIIFPDCFVNGSSTVDPKHVMFRRLKSQDKHGRFKPNFEVDLGNFPTIDARMKDTGLIAKVVEADIMDRDFFPIIYDMINGKFGNDFFMLPAQVALYGSQNQFARKSYIIYHEGEIGKSRPYGMFDRENTDGGSSKFRFYFDQ